MNYHAGINHTIGRLQNHAGDLVQQAVVPDSLIIQELYIYLRKEMHPRYEEKDKTKRHLARAHAHKLAKKWAELNAHETNTYYELNRYQATINKAVRGDDNAYMYAEFNENTSRDRINRWWERIFRPCTSARTETVF